MLITWFISLIKKFQLLLIFLSIKLLITRSNDFVYCINSTSSVYNCDQTNCLHGVCWSKSSQLTDLKSCYCDNGFTGYQCSINYDDCLLNQCQNGGTCVDRIADFDCICPPGYTGKLCQTEINECISAPCLSGGSCIDEINGFRCQCLPGFSGHFCEIDISVCNETGFYDGTETSKCLNGGQCSEGPGLEYKCQCQPGFEGHRCETIINQCEPNPCLNGSRCVNHIADFTCICPPDRTGKTCENDLIPCEINNCQHGAICLITSSSTRSCYCVPGFYGVHCERHFNECMSSVNVCANDGLCIGGLVNYSCSCLNGFKGKHCEINCSNNYESIIDQRCFNEKQSTTNQSITTLEPSIGIDYSSTTTSTIKTIISNGSSLESSTYHQQLANHSFDNYNESVVDYESAIINSQSPFSNQFNSSFSVNQHDDLSSLKDNQTIPSDLVDINDLFSPSFNGESSYMVITSDDDQYVSSLTINLSFLSYDSNGTIISTRSTIDSRYFIIIYLNDFRLKVWFSCNSREMDLIEFPGLISASTFYPLTFQLNLQNNSCTARLTLNHNYTIISGQSVGSSSSSPSSPIRPLWPCFRDFYLGKMDPSLRSFSHIDNDNVHFNGCLKEININGLNLIKKIVNVTECQMASVCSNDPCNGRGKCLQSPTNWSCHCEPGYSGRRCQSANCSPNPCENDGLCLTTGSDFNCLCSNGSFGEYCQLDLNETLPAFGYNDKGSSNSYMIYGLPNQTFHFEMRFRLMISNHVNQNNSLILFLGNTNNIRLRGRPIDFISISLLEDMIVYQINMGQGTKVMVGKMNSTRVHTIYLGQHRQLAWLIVDDLKRDLEIVQTRHNKLNIEPFLYIGNHKASPLRTFTTFQGCVFDIQVRNDPKLPFQQLNNILWSSNVNECTDLHKCRKG